MRITKWNKQRIIEKLKEEHHKWSKNKTRRGFVSYLLRNNYALLSAGKYYFGTYNNAFKSAKLSIRSYVKNHKR